MEQSEIPTHPLKRQRFACKAYELFFPLEGAGSHQAGNPRKIEKIYKIPLPGLTPEIREKVQKITKNVFLEKCYLFFGAISPFFGGSDRGGGDFVIFPHFLEISAQVAFQAL